MSPSLYLHLPFCSKWCSYCAFYSEPHARWEGEWRTRYVTRLAEEIRLEKARWGSFDTLFLGGGNPLELSTDDLVFLLQTAGKTSETTVEMNPESLSDSDEPLFSSGLVSRASMGVQSLDCNTLMTLGRNSSLRETLDGIAALQAYKERYGTKINFDLIACVPGQTLQSAKADIDRLLSMSEPDHLSLYALTLEPGTALERKVKAKEMMMPDSDRQADMLFALWDYLKEKGFEHYEVSNFARNGAYCQHNLRYWRLEPYVGLGSHAAGRIRDAKGVLHATECMQDLFSYAKGEPLDGYGDEPLSQSEEMEEWLLTGLRTKWGIGKEDFRQRFHQDFDMTFQRGIDRIAPALFRNPGASFVLTEQGVMVLDSVLLELAMDIG